MEILFLVYYCPIKCSFCTLNQIHRLSVSYLSYRKQESPVMKCLTKNEELFTLKCSTFQAFICCLYYLLPTVTEESLCVSACVCYRASRHRKADRQRATHLGNFPKNSWPLASARTHAQSASISNRLAKVSATQTVRLFRRLFVVSLCDCLQKPFSLIHLPIVAKSFHDQTSSDPVFITDSSESLLMSCYFQLCRTNSRPWCNYTTI